MDNFVTRTLSIVQVSCCTIAFIKAFISFLLSEFFRISNEKYMKSYWNSRNDVSNYISKKFQLTQNLIHIRVSLRVDINFFKTFFQIFEVLIVDFFLITALARSMS